MVELRFQILVRRKAESVHDSTKFATEDYEDLSDLLSDVHNFIVAQITDEEEYNYRNEGEDE